MSGFHHVATRHSPPHVRKSAVKAIRSAPSSKSTGTPKIVIKGARTRTKHAKDEEDDIFAFEDDEDEMATTFLQYCAMCEKQIVVPNNSILYCSESCRRRDSSPPTSNPYLALALSQANRMPSHHPSLTDPFGSTLPTYIPALQPTPRFHKDARIPPVYHEGNSDLDPTEWKPAETSLEEGKSPPNGGGASLPASGRASPANSWKPKLPHRPSSEAFTYLSQFHRSSDSLISKRSPRPGHNHSHSQSQSRSLITRATPSLSHTPTASTSSEDSLAGTPYDFVARPAVSVPTTAVTTTLGSDGATMTTDGANDLTYEKKDVVAEGLKSASGSLKKLLRGRV